MTLSELGVGYPIRINTFVLAWHQVLPAKPQVRGLSTLICLIGTILRLTKSPAVLPGNLYALRLGIDPSPRRARGFRPAISDRAVTLGEPNLRGRIGIAAGFEARITEVTTTRD